MISGAMLGLGRALGETMAVAIILSPADIITFNIISNQNPNTIAANIALKFPESAGIERQPADRHRPRAVPASRSSSTPSPAASPGAGFSGADG